MRPFVFLAPLSPVVSLCVSLNLQVSMGMASPSYSCSWYNCTSSSNQAAAVNQLQLFSHLCQIIALLTLEARHTLAFCTLCLFHVFMCFPVPQIPFICQLACSHPQAPVCLFILSCLSYFLPPSSKCTNSQALSAIVHLLYPSFVARPDIYEIRGSALLVLYVKVNLLVTGSTAQPVKTVM